MFDSTTFPLDRIWKFIDNPRRAARREHRRSIMFGLRDARAKARMLRTGTELRARVDAFLRVHWRACELARTTPTAPRPCTRRPRRRCIRVAALAQPTGDPDPDAGHEGVAQEVTP